MVTRTRATCRRATTRRDYPAFAVTVDVVILTMSGGVLQVLLVRRGQAPFAGLWAIPGGFKRPTETLDEAARRELAEETGVDAASLLTQFGAYGDPGRDPRMNVVTVGYLAVLRDVGAVVAGTDAAEASLVPVDDVLGGRSSWPSTTAGSCATRSSVSARPGGHRVGHGVRRADVHAGRAARGLRGGLGRAAGLGQLPAAHRRRRRLGDPDRAAQPARRRRGKPAELSRPAGRGARRADPAPAPNAGR